VGQGGQQRRPEAGRLIMPAMETGWHVGDEGCIKPGGIRGYVDLALNAGWVSGQSAADRPWLGAVLGKTRRTES
jgi:hypothetical protein